MTTDRRSTAGMKKKQHHSLRHEVADKPWQAIRTEAVESLLAELGVIDSAEVDAIVQHYEENVGPKTGAQVVAKAWCNDAFKKRLLTDGLKACAELGIGGPETEHLVVVENTATIHNVVVCTLCSCYPWPILGLPPAWYKSSEYRSRLVREPRALLEQMGLTLPQNVEIRVWDSVSEIRYLVLPERPKGSEALNEADLVELITRDSMIGVATLADYTPAHQTLSGVAQ